MPDLSARHRRLVSALNGRLSAREKAAISKIAKRIYFERKYHDLPNAYAVASIAAFRAVVPQLVAEILAAESTRPDSQRPVQQSLF